MRDLTWYLTDYEPDLVRSHVNEWNTLPLTGNIQVHEFDPYSYEIDADDSERLREPGGGYFGEHVPKMKEFTVDLTAWLNSSTPLKHTGPLPQQHGIVTETTDRDITYASKISELKRLFTVGATGWFAWDDETSDYTNYLMDSYHYDSNVTTTTASEKTYRMSARVIKMDFMSKPQHHGDSVRAKIQFRAADPYIRVGPSVTFNLLRYVPVAERPDADQHSDGTINDWFSWYKTYGGERYYYSIEIEAAYDAMFLLGARNTMYPEITMRVPGYTGQPNDKRWDAEIRNSEWVEDFRTRVRAGYPGLYSEYVFDPYYFTFRGSLVTLPDNQNAVQSGSVNAFEFWKTPQVRLGTHPHIFTRPNIFTYVIPDSDIPTEAETAIADPALCHAKLTFQPKTL